MPAVAQTIIAQVRAAIVDPPKDVGNFDCMGTTTLDGKEYLAYRSVEKQADAGAATGAPRCTARSTSIRRRACRRSTLSPATNPTRRRLQGDVRLSGEDRDRGSPGRATGENEIEPREAWLAQVRVSRTSMMEKQTMRRLLTAMALLIAAGPAAHAACKDEVASALERQRKTSGFRMKTKMLSEQGLVDMTVDYMLPNRMRQVITSTAEPKPVETVIIGRDAWSRIEGEPWRPMHPQIADALAAQMQETLGEIRGDARRLRVPRQAGRRRQEDARLPGRERRAGSEEPEPRRRGKAEAARPAGARHLRRSDDRPADAQHLRARRQAR